MLIFLQRTIKRLLRIFSSDSLVTLLQRQQLRVRSGFYETQEEKWLPKIETEVGCSDKPGLFKFHHLSHVVRSVLPIKFRVEAIVSTLTAQELQRLTMDSGNVSRFVL